MDWKEITLYEVKSYVKGPCTESLFSSPSSSTSTSTSTSTLTSTSTSTSSIVKSDSDRQYPSTFSIVPRVPPLRHYSGSPHGVCLAWFNPYCSIYGEQYVEECHMRGGLEMKYVYGLCPSFVPFVPRNGLYRRLTSSSSSSDIFSVSSPSLSNSSSSTSASSTLPSSSDVESPHTHHMMSSSSLITYLWNMSLFSLFSGLFICYFISSYKSHHLLISVLPVVFSEHHFYTSSPRSIPVSWSFSSKSIKKYIQMWSSNKELKLVLELKSSNKNETEGKNETNQNDYNYKREHQY